MKKSLLKEISESLLRDSPQVIGPDYLRGMTSSTVPIRVSSPRSEWEIIDSPKRLSRVFFFSDFPTLKSFLGHILDYENQTQHHAEIKINEMSVEVSLFTRDLNAITELDYDYAKFSDVIYRDLAQ